MTTVESALGHLLATIVDARSEYDEAVQKGSRELALACIAKDQIALIFAAKDAYDAARLLAGGPPPKLDSDSAEHCSSEIKTETD